MKKIAIISAMLLVVPLVAFASPIPDTGQTNCYDEVGTVIACPTPGQPFYGQDAQYGNNLQSYIKLDASGNDLPVEATEWVMVRDNVTGLIWQPETALGTYTFQEALTHCENLRLGGYDNWRIPTVKELSFIVDRTRIDPSIDIAYFPNTVLDYHWTSNNYWLVRFSWGYTNNSGNNTDSFYLRAVRGTPLANNFIDNGDETVSDTATGLMWQKATAPGIYNWQQALSYCENLTLAEYDDWRLPNVNELQSLLDYTRSNPSIDPLFPNTESDNYWSSTTYARTLNSAWFIFFYDGTIYGGGGVKSGSYYYVRAVRGEEPGTFDDSDEDGVADAIDNCPNHPNGPVLGTCTSGPYELIGIQTCTSNEECDPNGFCSMNQEDIYPPGGNNLGDACECEGDFDRDGDVDADDVTKFLEDFGRFEFNNPCP